MSYFVSSVPAASPSCVATLPSDVPPDGCATSTDGADCVGSYWRGTPGAGAGVAGGAGGRVVAGAEASSDTDANPGAETVVVGGPTPEPPLLLISPSIRFNAS